MSNNKEKTIIEINGVKMEVDLRTAVKIENFRVGSKVKVLMSESDNSSKVYPGIVIGFEDFKKLPTIVIAYLKSDYFSTGVNFLYFNSETKNTELIISDTKYLPIEKAEVVRKMNREIENKKNELKDLEGKKVYFEKNFGVYFDVEDSEKVS